MGTCPAHRRGVLDDRVEVGDDNALRALLDYQGPLAQVFLMELALGDVARNAEHADDVSRAIVQRSLGGEETAFAVRGGERFFVTM